MGFKALRTADPIPLLILDTNGFCDLNCIMCPQSWKNPKSPYLEPESDLEEKESKIVPEEKLSKIVPEEKLSESAYKEKEPKIVLGEKGPNFKGQSKTDSYKRGQMDLAFYKSLIDEICSGNGLRANAILPFWNGEGILHPDFAEMIHYAAEKNRKNKGFNVFSLHTNFNSADEEISKAMINSQIFGPITLSLDAISASTYDKIRQGGNFHRLMNNIKFFLKYREEKGFKYPSLVFQFIVMEDNKHEAKEFYRHWSETLKKLGRDFKVGFDDNIHMDKDTIFFRRLNVDKNEDQLRSELMHREVLETLGLVKSSSDGAERIIRSDEYREEKKVHILTKKIKPTRAPCVGLWQHFGIRWDGQASACCIDFKAQMELGNAKEEGLWNIWTGARLRQFRLWHLMGKFHKIPVCAPCRNQPFHYYSDGEIGAWLRDENLDHMIVPVLKRLGRIAND